MLTSIHTLNPPKLKVRVEEALLAPPALHPLTGSSTQAETNMRNRGADPWELGTAFVWRKQLAYSVMPSGLEGLFLLLLFPYQQGPQASAELSNGITQLVPLGWEWRFCCLRSSNVRRALTDLAQWPRLSPIISSLTPGG